MKPQNPEEDRLLLRRVVRLRGAIEDDNTNEVIARMLYLQSLSQEPIHLLIDSPGGLVTAGLAIVHTIHQLRAPVFTHCNTLAGSMAGVILASGKPGFRTASNIAQIIFSMPMPGNSTRPELLTQANRFGEILITELTKTTRLFYEQIRTLFLEARPISAEQAREIGLIDQIDHFDPL